MPCASPSPTRVLPPPLQAGHALFLDIDGCLVDFADTPDGAVVPAALLDVIARVAGALDGALALVSGRAIASIDAMFAPLVLSVAGQHGHVRRDASGLLHAPAAAQRDAAFDAARAEALRVIADHPAAVFEDKPLGFALHWRRAPAAGAALRAFADAAVQHLPGHVLQPGDHVIEVVPQGADKGTAIEAFLGEPPFLGRVPVFLGDDLTDEHGFDVVNARGGYSVLVGTRMQSVACFQLRDPAAVSAWLRAFPGATAAGPARSNDPARVTR